MQEYQNIHHTFKPIYDENSKILILGSFPSVKSRENNFYYGHPQNRFWKVLASVFDTDVPETIEEKKEMLLKYKIAIWDVIESCTILGSSDTSIKDVVVNDFTEILQNSKIEKIYVNGTKAYELYHKYAEKKTGIKAVKLPSTSPANAVWNLERLCRTWRKQLRGEFVMENILTYVEKYRDKDFTQMPFNVIDSLILSQVSYYNYSKGPFVRPEFNISLSIFFQNCITEKILNHTMTTDGDRVLIEALKPGGRHGNLRASHYADVIDDENGIQFSAITFELGNDEYYIAFRGTDNTVTGWKEDLNLTYLEAVPAQKAALRYAVDVFGEFSGNFYIGGHSKGGNLAVYTAMNLPEPYKNRLLEVHDFDGPGFMEEIYKTKEYQEIRPLIRKYVPQSSIVGMMWERDNNYIVVHSEEKGFQQHDPFTWTIHDKEFVVETEVDHSSRYMKRILERWVEELSFDERKKLIDTVFDLIFETGISKFYELSEERLQKIRLLLEGIGEVPEEERKLVWSAVKHLILISVQEIPQRVKERLEE